MKGSNSALMKNLRDHRSEQLLKMEEEKKEKEQLSSRRAQSMMELDAEESKDGPNDEQRLPAEVKQPDRRASLRNP